MIVMAMEWWQTLLAVVVALIGSARLTRILTYDDFPPAVWLRITWAKVTKDGSWAKLAQCYWCAGPWVTLFAIVTFLLTFEASWVAWTWWLLYTWMSLSYLVSMWVDRDERPE